MVDFTSLPCELGPIGELPSPAEPIDGGSIDGPIDSGATPIGPFEPAPTPVPIDTGGGGGNGNGGTTGTPVGPSTSTPTGPSTPGPTPGPFTGGGGGGGNGGTGPTTLPSTPIPGPISGPGNGTATSGSGSTGSTGATGTTGEGPFTSSFDNKLLHTAPVVENESGSSLENYEYGEFNPMNEPLLGVDDTYYNISKEASQSILVQDSVLMSVFNTSRDTRINDLIRNVQLSLSKINEFTTSISTTTLKDSLQKGLQEVLFGLHTPDGRPYAENTITTMLRERVKDSTISTMEVDYILSLKARAVLTSPVARNQSSLLQKSEFGVSRSSLNSSRNFVANNRTVVELPIIPNQTRALLRARQKNKSLNPYAYSDLNRELLKLWYILPTDIYRRLEIDSNDNEIVPIFINNDDSISVETSSGSIVNLPVSPYVYQLPVIDTSGNTHYLNTNSDLDRAVTLPNITEQACLFDAGSEFKTSLEVGIPGGCKALDVETSSGIVDMEICNNSLIVQTSSGSYTSIPTLTNYLVVDTSGADAMIPIHDFGFLEFNTDPSATVPTFYLLELVPSSVEETNLGSTILNRKSTAKYRLVTESNSYIQDLIKFRVYPWKVFPVDVNDPILNFFKFSSNYSFTFNTFSLKKYGENHGEPIFVRRIPKVIVVLPTDRTSYNFFHNQSLLVNPNLRRINFGALPEPDYYNTGFDKHWLRIVNQYPELDVYGEINPNAKKGEYYLRSTLLNSGMVNPQNRLRSGFRAAFDIVNYLNDTYYLDGGVMWSDVFVRMSKEEYSTFDRGIPEEIINAFMDGDYTGVKVFHNSTGPYRLETRLLELKPGKTDTLPIKLTKEVWQE